MIAEQLFMLSIHHPYMVQIFMMYFAADENRLAENENKLIGDESETRTGSLVMITG